ncbi:hypothetical protein TNCV_3073561 [Trichonephila clavipes]|nr:hypothetical protein TNCV_3073561 [Trichonephila clavipes]
MIKTSPTVLRTFNLASSSPDLLPVQYIWVMIGKRFIRLTTPTSAIAISTLDMRCNNKNEFGKMKQEKQLIYQGSHLKRKQDKLTCSKKNIFGESKEVGYEFLKKWKISHLTHFMSYAIGQEQSYPEKLRFMKKLL